MLSSLHIENIAVIEKTDISFGKGFNVLTGETGAGKSIIIDAIDMVLGERTSKDIIRNGANNAFVGAVFYDISDAAESLLNEYGIPSEEDGNLLIQREISLDGKSVCRINGRQVTASVLKELGRLLINIHGQHDNQTLLHPETHITYLDQFAENEQIRAEYLKAYEKVNNLKKEIKKLSIAESEKERKIETLTYQINEIESVALRDGEEEELTEQKNALVNFERIAEGVNFSFELLYNGEENACAMLSNAVSSLENAVRYSAELKSIYDKILSLKYELDDAADELGSYKAGLEYNEGSLDEIELRLDTIYKLKRKYGSTIYEMLHFLGNAKNELMQIEESDEELLKLKKELEKALSELENISVKLTASRKKASEKLESLIANELEFLDMAKVKITADIKKSNEFLTNGSDIIEFLISTNVGESLKPLSKIASGGELSRIMLSLKNVLAQKENIGTLIFDEVDSGVSGKAAHKIGLKLKQVAIFKQIICVTHLAQIAALANYHYLIKKDVVNGKTFTDVKTLERQERIEELARIMGGMHISEATLKSAEEMLEI